MDAQTQHGAAAMTAHLPPVPPAGRSPKGPGETGKDETQAAAQSGQRPATKDFNTGEQGSSGNTKQNTTNQGLQQDR